MGLLRGPPRNVSAIATRAPRPPGLQAKSHRPWSSQAAKRSGNAIHPIATALSSGVGLGDARVESDANSGGCEYTADVAIHHALDLPDPCAIRSCPHTLRPQVRVVVDDVQTSEAIPAMRHARNHTSWSKAATYRHRGPVPGSGIARILILVDAQCTRHPAVPAIVPIGQLDELRVVLPMTGEIIELRQFFPVYRHHRVDGVAVKYFAGKLKLTIRIRRQLTTEASTVKTTTTTTETNETREPPPAHQLASDEAHAAPPASRPPFALGASLGEALQLKRRQLKATVAPETVNHALVKAADDPEAACRAMRELEEATRHRHLPRDELEIVGPIGEGVHARVYHAYRRRHHDDVALKEFRYRSTHAWPPVSVLAAFRHEYEMLGEIDAVGTPPQDCFTRLLGVVLTPTLALVTEFCRDGSLARCMSDVDTWNRVDRNKRMRLALGIALGLRALHARGIVHRDIKPHNLMITGLTTATPHVKIGDLGSAARLVDGRLTEETGSSGYTAPEVFQSSGYDAKCDIWSFGIVLWELLHEDPSARAQGNPLVAACGEALVRAAREGTRPVLTVAHVSARGLLERCWAFDPSVRPDAARIVTELGQWVAMDNTNV